MKSEIWMNQYANGQDGANGQHAVLAKVFLKKLCKRSDRLGGNPLQFPENIINTWKKKI